MSGNSMIATLVGLISAVLVYVRHGGSEDFQDRLLGVGFCYLIVVFAKSIGGLPSYGLVERMASDYGRADLRAPFTILAWALFLFVAWSAVFSQAS